tara:strand:+ start:285 stop:572 length:288 start_codon:yes stop_codon:yes gene_type:complete
MTESSIKIIKQLGPSVLKAKMPNDVVDKLNSYIDKIVIDEKKLKDLNMGENLVGDVTQEFKLEKDIMFESGFINFLAVSSKRWIELETKKKTYQI